MKPNASGSEWTLIQLDREVEGHEQPIYLIGHPCGLHVKYAPGLVVETSEKAYFMSQMDVYIGNCGCPVFCAETHEMEGMLVQSDMQDFSRYNDAWISVRYPNKRIESDGDRYIKLSEFEISKLNKFI